MVSQDSITASLQLIPQLRNSSIISDDDINSYLTSCIYTIVLLAIDWSRFECAVINLFERLLGNGNEDILKIDLVCGDLQMIFD